MKKLAKRIVKGDKVVALNGEACPVLEASRVRHPDDRHRQIICIIYEGGGERRVSFHDLKSLVPVLTDAEAGVS
jgi:hypothetical protein